jgi:sulfate adenylyltransferase subunit 1
MEILRITTAGSVDDGKSTLIGRLLYETQSLKIDQVETIEAKSKSLGYDYIDFSLATDGLLTEREQGITIDVSHLYFSTPKRRFIVADAPGHVEYTRNMVTGASNVEVAIILLDARKGVMEQTKRHLYITQLLGIKHLIFTINKMDLIDYDQEQFDSIVEAIKALVNQYDWEPQLSFIPVSALKGDNVIVKSNNMPWYEGNDL